MMMMVVMVMIAVVMMGQMMMVLQLGVKNASVNNHQPAAGTFATIFGDGKNLQSIFVFQLSVFNANM